MWKCRDPEGVVRQEIQVLVQLHAESRERDVQRLRDVGSDKLSAVGIAPAILESDDVVHGHIVRTDKRVRGAKRRIRHRAAGHDHRGRQSETQTGKPFSSRHGTSPFSILNECALRPGRVFCKYTRRRA